MNTNLLLTVGLLTAFLTAGLAGSLVNYQNQQKLERQLQRLGAQTSQQLTGQLAHMALALRGMRGAVKSAGDEFNGDSFAAFLQHSDLLQEFHSLRFFCFIANVPYEDTEAFVQRARAENAKFQLRQYTAHTDNRYLLTYIAPRNSLEDALGLDLASEPARRATLEQAAKRKGPQLSPPLHGTGKKIDSTPDFLLVLPVFKTGANEPYGWVGAPLFFNDLWPQLDALPLVQLQIQDGTFSYHSDWLAASPTIANNASNPKHWPWQSPHLSHQTQLPLMGRHWVIKTTATPSLIEHMNLPSAVYASLFTLLLGSLCTGLLFLLVQRRQDYKSRERSQREQLGILIDAAPCGMMFIDQNYNFVAVNQQLCQQTRYARDELVGRSFNLLMGHDASGQNLLQQNTDDDIAHPGKGVSFEMFTKRKDGSQFPAALGFSTLTVDRRRFIVATLEDITQRKAIEQKMADSELLFRNLANAMPQHVWTAEDSGAVTFINQQMANYYGRTVAQLQPENWPEIVHPDDLKGVHANWARCIEDGANYEAECRLRTQAGDYRWHIIRAQPVQLADGSRHWYGTNTDITEHKQLLLESEANAQNTQAIIDSVVDALITIDEAGQITSTNWAARKLFGYSKAQLQGQNVNMLMPEPYRAQHDGYLARYRHTGERHIIGNARQLEGMHKDGNRFKIELRVAENYRNGKRYFLGMIRDITERFYNERLLAAQDHALGLIARNAELPVILEALAKDIEGLGQDMLVSFLLLDASGRRLLHGAAPSLPTEYNAAVNGMTIGPKSSSCGASAFLRKQIIVSDIATDPLWEDYRDLALPHSLRACWSTPIYAQNELLGVFAIYFQSQRAPSVRHQRIINMAVHVSSLAISHSRRENQIKQLAFYDSLTQLPNRALGLDRLNRAIADAHRRDESLAIIFIDLDGFKNINDSLGHHVGDKLLKQAALRLGDCIRENDTVARLGGDEFFIILHGTSNKIAEVVTEKILKAMSDKFLIDNQELHLSCSMGVSLFPKDGQDASLLLRNADAAMYSAKGAGRNTVKYYTDDMNRSAVERITLEQEIRAGIERNEFELYYQPRINNATNTIIGVEALVRWQHPSRGLLAPNVFIPIAEQSGLIVALGDWVLQQACRQLSEWMSQGCAPIAIAVNLSPRQFHDAQLIDKVTQALAQAQLPANQLELEITESMVMDEGPHIIATLHELKAVGVNLAIDDFGTGYSNLSRLKHLPVDVIKIDKSFVDGIPDDLDDVAIATTIISMAHHLKLKIVAEGVETYEQQQFLSSRDCDEMQGYLFGKPETAEKTARLVGIKAAPAK